MDQPEQQQDAPKNLKVLSLNCWGLKFVADKRKERLRAIAQWIGASSGYDIIALQEIWVRSDFDHVAELAKEAGLPYSRFFYSGAIGSGLAILSAHPIASTFVFPYPLNGYPLHFIEGDFFAGKSVCGACVEVEGVGKVDVLNTHMYAPGGEADNVDGAHRVAQAWELARIVQEKAERGRHVIVMGDFNSQPGGIIMRFLNTYGSLHDAFTCTHSEPPSITSATHRALTPLEVLHQHGITCDSPLNTYSAPKLAKRHPRCDEILRGGKRLDYVLYRSPVSSPWHLHAESVEPVLTQPAPGLGVSYSDHFGLEAVLRFLPSDDPLVPPTPPPLSTDDLNKAVANLSTAYRSSLSASQDQLRLFAVALVMVPVFCVATSYQPLRAVTWLFVLLSVATGAGGATMLYTGFVGGSWESGALRNVIAEMESEVQRRRGAVATSQGRDMW